MPATPSPLSKLPLLLLTLLLTPAVGLASTQELLTQEAAPSPAQEQEEAEAPKPQEKPQEREALRLLDESELPRARAPWGERIAAELGLGLFTGAAGGAAGTLLVGLVACRASFGACLIGSVLGGLTGFAFAGSAGVWWAGSLTGANGNYGSALLGSLVGVLASVPLYFALSYGALIAPLLGAVIGYGMSISPEPQVPAVALGSTRIRPLLSVSPQGSFVGLGGHF
jgi:hypothetical protein